MRGISGRRKGFGREKRISFSVIKMCIRDRICAYQESRSGSSPSAAGIKKNGGLRSSNLFFNKKPRGSLCVSDCSCTDRAEDRRGQNSSCFRICRRNLKNESRLVTEPVSYTHLDVYKRQGHIIEQGTHELLLARHGFYAELYNSQFEG